MADKKIIAQIYARSRAEIVKRHHDEYKEIVRANAAAAGVSMRVRRSADEKAAADAEKRAAVAERRAARAEAKAAKERAAVEAKIEKARAALAALETESA